MAELRDIALPEHLANMTEFKLIDEISDEMVSDFEDEMEARHDDILITTATETGIARREAILGLTVDPSEDLEARRARVLFWWYNKMPYTRRVLEGKVRALCGEGNYTFEMDFDTDPLGILKVGIARELGWGVINTVYSLLDRLVMLTVILDIRAVDSEDLEAPTYLGVGMRTYVNDAILSDNV